MKRASLLLFFLIATFASRAQYTDLGGWYSIQGSKDIIKDLVLSAEAQARADHQFGNLESAFTDISVTRKFNSLFRLGLNYRIGYRYSDVRQFDLRQRYNVDAMLRYKVGKVGLGYRLRYQFAQSGLTAGDDYQEYSSAFRHKISASRKIMKKTVLKIGGEVWFGRAVSGSFAPSDSRLSLKVERKLKKRHYATFGLIWNRAFDRMVPNNEYVFALGYSYQFKGDIFKKKKSED